MPIAGDPKVLFVSKSTRNPFKQMITVGRSPNNDIVLEDKSVSKVHGWFKRTDFRWWIHDQPSTNGTFVAETRVGTAGLPIADGDKVSFGQRLVFSFYTARGLHQLINGNRP
jgi:pSer/pThr/pTyr-binding forkhead associated (FHA) protein